MRFNSRFCLFAACLTTRSLPSSSSTSELFARPNLIRCLSISSLSSSVILTEKLQNARSGKCPTFTRSLLPPLCSSSFLCPPVPTTPRLREWRSARTPSASTNWSKRTKSFATSSFTLRTKRWSKSSRPANGPPRTPTFTNSWTNSRPNVDTACSTFRSTWRSKDLPTPPLCSSIDSYYYAGNCSKLFSIAFISSHQCCTCDFHSFAFLCCDRPKGVLKMPKSNKKCCIRPVTMLWSDRWSESTSTCKPASSRKRPNERSKTRFARPANKASWTRTQSDHTSLFSQTSSSKRSSFIIHWPHTFCGSTRLLCLLRWFVLLVRSHWLPSQNLEANILWSCSDPIKKKYLSIFTFHFCFQITSSLFFSFFSYFCVLRFRHHSIYRLL